MTRMLTNGRRNMCWVIGGLISSGMLRGLLQIDNQWGYRIRKW